ncbi:sialate O-acetylesterase [Parasediminibacterium sp. JCM 36343]|uniref:sialate O-acetylesterase n=1 Tax=Parasediminibacterium sp. JCM 36343 TaxID=3374279 RepID=UPI003978ADCA
MNKIIVVIFLLICNYGFAFVKPNSLFSNNMVLQQGVAVPVWGTANDGEKISISFNGQKISTTAKEGKWMLKLKPLKAGGPFTMTITGDNTITIENVLVGEVWVCSGQSNMERQLGLRGSQKPIVNYMEEAAKAKYPEIRQYFVAKKAVDSFVYDANSKWVVCDTASVLNFSAVGYFFARDLYNHLHVPIGMIFTSVGGTPAENWTTRAALESNPELKKLVEDYDKALKAYPEATEKFKVEQYSLLAKWKEDSLAAAIAKKAIPAKPAPPRNPAGGAGGLYNGMINPLIPYAIKGVIWYQGESNGGRAKEYQTLFPTMIKDWRQHWNQGDFPFLFVQIAPFRSANPKLREAQLLTLQKVPNTAMAVTTDCGDSADIHPPFKQPVGNRLSIAARALAYNEKIEYSGPLYKGFEVKDNTITVSFTHVGNGLVAKDGELKGFVISGDGKKFLPATAVIKGNMVIISSPEISKPAAARYGFEAFPKVNLYNEEGLPASPFRTDVD